MTAATAFVNVVFVSIACAMPVAQQPAPTSPPLTIAWQQEIDQADTHELAVGTAAVVVAAADAGISAYAVADGRLLWRNPALNSRQAVAIGSLVVLVVDDSLHALDQATGQAVWRAALDAATTAAPLRLSATDALLLVTRGADVQAFKHDGASAWKGRMPSAVATSFVSVSNVLVAGLDQPAIVAVDPATGAVIWLERLRSAPSALTSIGTELFVATADGELLAFQTRAARPDRRWRYRDRAIASIGAAAISEKRVFYALTDNTVKAFDRSGGTKVWTARLESRPIAGPILVGETIIVPLASGGLAQIPASDGKATQTPKDEAPAETSAMSAAVLSQGSLYAVQKRSNTTTTLVAWRAASK